jgi:hypothetical protein
LGGISGNGKADGTQEAADLEATEDIARRASVATGEKELHEQVATLRSEQVALRRDVDKHDIRLDNVEGRVGSVEVQLAKMVGYAAGAAAVLTVVLHYVDKLWKS